MSNKIESKRREEAKRSIASQNADNEALPNPSIFFYLAGEGTLHKAQVQVRGLVYDVEYCISAVSDIGYHKCSMCRKRSNCGRAPIIVQRVYSGYIDMELSSDIGKRASTLLGRKITKFVCVNCADLWREQVEELSEKVI